MAIVDGETVGSAVYTETEKGSDDMDGAEVMVKTHGGCGPYNVCGSNWGNNGCGDGYLGFAFHDALHVQEQAMEIAMLKNTQYITDKIQYDGDKTRELVVAGFAAQNMQYQHDKDAANAAKISELQTQIMLMSRCNGNGNDK